MPEPPLFYLCCPFCGETLKVRIEEHRERKYCPDCSWTYYPTPHVAVAAVVTEVRSNQDGDPCVLMVLRDRAPFRNTWMFPAGFLEWGEHPEEALARELKEETGLTVKYADLWRIEKALDDPRSPKHLVIFYRVQAVGEIINNDINENSAVEWKSVREQITVGFPHHQIVFDEIRAHINDFFSYDFM